LLLAAGDHVTSEQVRGLFLLLLALGAFYPRAARGVQLDELDLAPRWQLRHLRFVGNDHVKDGVLQAAMVTKPRILLMDEPFAALDEITRFKLNNDLLELWQRERLTVVFVTHSVFESAFLSQRIAVMAARPGRIIEDIAVDAPYPRLADYRTSPPYNEHCRRASAALERAMAHG